MLTPVKKRRERQFLKMFEPSSAMLRGAIISTQKTTTMFVSSIDRGMYCMQATAIIMPLQIIKIFYHFFYSYSETSTK